MQDVGQRDLGTAEVKIAVSLGSSGSAHQLLKYVPSFVSDRGAEESDLDRFRRWMAAPRRGGGKKLDVRCDERVAMRKPGLLPQRQRGLGRSDDGWPDAREKLLHAGPMRPSLRAVDADLTGVRLE